MGTNTATNFEDNIRRLQCNDPSLSQISVDYFTLIQKDVCQRLADAMRGNTFLKILYFYPNWEPDFNNFEIIISALSESNVRGVFFERWNESSFSCVSTLLSMLGEFPSVKQLRIHIEMSDARAITISKIISSNTTLQSLILTGTGRVSDESAFALADALKSNNTLNEFEMYSCVFSEAGQQAVRNIVYDDSSVASLRNSNHTIVSLIKPPQKLFGPRFLGDASFALGANHMGQLRTGAAVSKKMVRYLSKKYGIKLKHQSFSEEDLKVMPLVLGFISDNCDVNKFYGMVRHLPFLMPDRAQMKGNSPLE